MVGRGRVLEAVGGCDGKDGEREVLYGRTFYHFYVC